MKKRKTNTSTAPQETHRNKNHSKRLKKKIKFSALLKA
jgi:hypothetical protein